MDSSKFAILALYIYVILVSIFANYYNVFMTRILIWNNKLGKNFEELILCRLIWYALFGFLVDKISWRIIYYIQLLIWVLILFTFYTNWSLTAIINLAYLSSSYILVFYIGVVKICGALNVLWYISWISSLVVSLPIAIKFMAGDNIIHNYSADSIEPHNTNYNSGEDVPFICIPIICCTCLAFLSMTKESSQRMIKSERSKLNTLKIFLKLIVLKLFIYIPSYLTLSYTNSNLGQIKNISELSFILTIVMQLVVIPALTYIISSRTLLLANTCLLFILHLILGIFVDSAESNAVTYVTMSVVMSLFHPLFEYYFICELQLYPGTTISLLNSTHLLLRYLCDQIWSTIKHLGPGVLIYNIFLNGILDYILSIFNYLWEFFTLGYFVMESSNSSHLIIDFVQYIFPEYNSLQYNNSLFISYLGTVSLAFSFVILLRSL